MKNIEKPTAAAYATPADFCRIFSEQMSELFLLSFLLTANRDKAELCFAQALEDCSNSSRVFREWAGSWARRTVIQNAIRLAGPDLESEHEEWLANSGASVAAVPAPLSAVLGLNTFERFVYVMSVLERYTDQDCAVLLRCGRQKMVDGRLRALQHLAQVPEGASRSRGFTMPRFIAETA